MPHPTRTPPTGGRQALSKPRARPSGRGWRSPVAPGARVLADPLDRPEPDGDRHDRPGAGPPVMQALHGRIRAARRRWRSRRAATSRRSGRRDRPPRRGRLVGQEPEAHPLLRRLVLPGMVRRQHQVYGRHNEQGEQRADRKAACDDQPHGEARDSTAPVATINGTTPSTMAAVVIRIGRRRMEAAATMASRREPSGICCSLATSTIRMPCLLMRPISVTRPTWV